jgi:hypothetical protein
MAVDSSPAIDDGASVMFVDSLRGMARTISGVGSLAVRDPTLGGATDIFEGWRVRRIFRADDDMGPSPIEPTTTLPASYWMIQRAVSTSAGFTLAPPLMIKSTP